MSIDVDLRKMTRDDLPYVNFIRNHDLTRFFLRNTKKISLDETYEWFDKTSPAWYVIVHEQEAVGYMRTSQDSGESICIGCDIHPEMRGKGYAKAAYKKFITLLYSLGYHVIWLEVFENNETALNLYRQLNFQEINRRQAEARQAIVMVHIRENH
jgi:ribosomal protein S18 acetylase RimI-like enzyme